MAPGDRSEDVTSALRRYFGHDSFTTGQQALVDTVLDGRDLFALMPTGSGKSLGFQLPAVLLPGVTLVVSPLISLMKDQVDELTRRGIRAGRCTRSHREFGPAEAARAARMYRSLKRAGGRDMNIAIAACAIEHCARFWTLNPDDFVDLPGLELYDPAR